MRKIQKLVSGAILLCLAGTASSQSAYIHWSFEAMAVRARSIFQGVVIGVKTPPAPPNTNPQIEFTVHVGKVLKGVPGKTVTFTGNLYGRREERYNLWKATKAKFLWFDLGLNDFAPDTTPHVQGLIAPQLFESWNEFRLSPPDRDEEKLKNYDERLPTGILGMDIQAYKSPEEVLDRLKSFLSTHPGNPPLVEFMIPNSIAQKINYDFGSNRLVIPAVSGLETILLELIRAPGSVLPVVHTEWEEIWIRAHCVRLLGYFKSKNNVMLLKSLLTDSGKGHWDHFPFTPENADRTYFWTRQAAYDVLTLWGVNVLKPDL